MKQQKKKGKEGKGKKIDYVQIQTFCPPKMRCIFPIAMATDTTSPPGVECCRW
jgi:hypothetical protein